MNLKKVGLTTLKVSALTLLTMGLSERAATAQSLTAEFSIPYEVAWGKSVLPAGQYTISMDGTKRPLLVRSSNGGWGALVMPVSVGAALANQPTSLILARGENGRDVRILNLREANVSLTFPDAKAERKVAKQLEGSATYADVTGK